MRRLLTSMLPLRYSRITLVIPIMEMWQDNQFLRITSLGEILRSMRLTVKVQHMLWPMII